MANYSPNVLRNRLLAKVRVDDSTNCWLWTAAKYPNGYGMFKGGPRRPNCAHRISYEIFVGKIPNGKHLDHLCKIVTCVNPLHLEPVSIRENVMRSNAPTAVNARKVRCIRGHEFSNENTSYSKRGWRKCKACQRLANHVAGSAL